MLRGKVPSNGQTKLEENKMKHYRRQVMVAIPSDIPAALHPAIYAKAEEINARFARDEGGSKAGCVESAAVAIARSGFGACLVPLAVALK